MGYVARSHLKNWREGKNNEEKPECLLTQLIKCICQNTKSCKIALKNEKIASNWSQPGLKSTTLSQKIKRRREERKELMLYQLHIPRSQFLWQVQDQTDQVKDSSNNKTENHDWNKLALCQTCLLVLIEHFPYLFILRGQATQQTLGTKISTHSQPGDRL